MALNSAIEWTDNSVPVVTGCSYQGVGCKNCYAPRVAWRLAHSPHAALAARYAGTVEKRPDGTPAWTGKVSINLDQLDAIQRARRPQAWFLSHVGDVFHNDVPPAVIDSILAVAALHPAQRLIILTKRYARMAALLAAGPRPLANVWLGASIANDADAAEAAPHLRTLHAAGWQVIASYEPAVGPVDWVRHGLTFLAGIISGGESGPRARPTHPDWHRATRDFCLRTGILFFFKQWGAWQAFYDRDQDDPDWRRVPPEPDDQTTTRLNHAGGTGFHGERLVYLRRRTKLDTGRLLDGRTWDDLPWRTAA